MLINPEDVRDTALVPVSVNDDTLNLYITKAQEFDLKPFLGRLMYFDMVSKIAAYQVALAGDAQYQATSDQQKMLDLLNGKTYTNSSGNTIIYNGLKGVIVFMTYHRYVKWSKFKSTATGVVKKRHDNSEPVSDDETASIVSQTRSEFNSLIVEVVAFLKDKQSDYPLWRYNPNNKYLRQSGPRVTAVDIYSVRNSRRGFRSINEFLP